MNAKRQDQLSLGLMFQAWQEREDAKALEQLVQLYIPLVHRTAQKMKMNLPHTVDKDDLVSWGHMGLLDALKKFEAERGWAFETYAVSRIRGAMIDGLRQEDWVPRSVRDKGKKLEEAYRALEQQHLRPPSQEELSEHIGISSRELQQLTTQVSMGFVMSLDEPIQHEDEPQTLISRIVDEQVVDQQQQVENQEEKLFLAKLIDELPEKEKLVLSMIYFEELTFSETAEVMGLTTGRISQLHSKAISRLRTAMAKAN